MTDCLDVVTIGVEHERAEVVDMVPRPKSGRSVVSPAGEQRRLVERHNGGARGRTEGDAKARDARTVASRQLFEADEQGEDVVGSILRQEVSDLVGIGARGEAERASAAS